MPASMTENNTQQSIATTKNHDGEQVILENWDKVGSALKRRIGAIDHETCEPGDEDPHWVGDMDRVYSQYKKWKLNLPRVKPFFAVKANPDPQVVRLLAGLGTGFDCASKTEIDMVLGLGVDPSRIIYAQPCKTNSYVRHAFSKNVKQMTFDNEDELYKIKRLFPDAELYLRIKCDDSKSKVKLSMKFGASVDDAEGLIQLANKLDLDLVGVSFHIGSLAEDKNAFEPAVLDARAVFDMATRHGFNMHTLDVGGGFSDESFEEMAAVLSAALEQHFPRHINIIAEPGRFFVATAFTLVCHVIARRTITDEDGKPSYMIYLNDGLYGNFSGVMFDHQTPFARLLNINRNHMFGDAAGISTEEMEARSGDHKASTIGKKGVRHMLFGPTCDGIDQITHNTHFANHTLDVGDWLYFENMGAYNKCSATRFNGFSDSHDIIYVASDAGVRHMLGMD